MKSAFLSIIVMLSLGLLHADSAMAQFTVKKELNRVGVDRPAQKSTSQNCADCGVSVPRHRAVSSQVQGSVTSILSDMSSKMVSEGSCQSQLNPILDSWGIGSFDRPNAGMKKWSDSESAELLIGYRGPYFYRPTKEYAPPKDVFNAKNEASFARALKNAGMRESVRQAVGEVARYNPSKFGNKISLVLTGYSRDLPEGSFPINKKYLAEAIFSRDCKLESYSVFFEGSGSAVILNSEVCRKINGATYSSGWSLDRVGTIVGRRIRRVTALEIVNACGKNGSLLTLLR